MIRKNLITLAYFWLFAWKILTRGILLKITLSKLQSKATSGDDVVDKLSIAFPYTCAVLYQDQIGTEISKNRSFLIDFLSGNSKSRYNLFEIIFDSYGIVPLFTLFGLIMLFFDLELVEARRKFTIKRHIALNDICTNVIFVCENTFTYAVVPFCIYQNIDKCSYKPNLWFQF